MGHLQRLRRTRGLRRRKPRHLQQRPLSRRMGIHRRRVAPEHHIRTQPQKRRRLPRSQRHLKQTGRHRKRPHRGHARKPGHHRPDRDRSRTHQSGRPVRHPRGPTALRQRRLPDRRPRRRPQPTARNTHQPRVAIRNPAPPHQPPKPAPPDDDRRPRTVRPRADTRKPDARTGRRIPDCGPARLQLNLRHQRRPPAHRQPVQSPNPARPDRH